jgi:hypothetical protein
MRRRPLPTWRLMSYVRLRVEPSNSNRMVRKSYGPGSQIIEVLARGVPLVIDDLRILKSRARMELSTGPSTLEP